MKKVTFEKYHCMGNDYLVYDPNKNEMELNEENIRLICDRNFGVGSDGSRGAISGSGENVC